MSKAPFSLVVVESRREWTQAGGNLMCWAEDDLVWVAEPDLSFSALSQLAGPVVEPEWNLDKKETPLGLCAVWRLKTSEMTRMVDAAPADESDEAHAVWIAAAGEKIAQQLEQWGLAAPGRVWRLLPECEPPNPFSRSLRPDNLAAFAQEFCAKWEASEIFREATFAMGHNQHAERAPRSL